LLSIDASYIRGFEQRRAFIKTTKKKRERRGEKKDMFLPEILSEKTIGVFIASQ